MNLERRIKLEKRIVRRIVRDLLAAGYEIAVNNGGDDNELPYSRNYTQIASVLFATDEEHLLVRKWDRDIHAAISGRQSFVFLVYGNDGWDVVNDYGVSLEPVMTPINEWINKLEVAQ